MELLFIDDLQNANPDAFGPISETGDASSAAAADGTPEKNTNADNATGEQTQLIEIKDTPHNSGGESTEAPGTQPTGSPWPFWIMIGAMILIMYFFMWRPERKRRKQMEEFRNGLKKGDKIITAGGIYGTIKEVHETSLLIEIEGNVTLRIDKNMVVADPSNGSAR